MKEDASLFSQTCADFNESEKYFKCILIRISFNSKSAVTMDNKLFLLLFEQMGLRSYSTWFQSQWQLLETTCSMFLNSKIAFISGVRLRPTDDKHS